MEDLDKYIVFPELPVKEAIARIEQTGRKTVVVTDDNKKVLGIFTDGDMRRWLLKNGDLSAPVKLAMNSNPIVFKEYEKKEVAKQLEQKALLVYPIVNDEGQLVNLVYWQDKDTNIHPTQHLPKNVNVVIMAGGEGKRLYPYTKVLPKPLIPIGDLPICTHVIESFRKIMIFKKIIVWIM